MNDLKCEFVLDERGLAPSTLTLSSLDYANYFSMHDICQGWIGNCCHIAAIMALTKNQGLLRTCVPFDNCLGESQRTSAYRFRFWKLGQWWDVVVDDYLPVNSSFELIFSHNKIYPNEFWVPLFEKAFAKYKKKNSTKRTTTK